MVATTFRPVKIGGGGHATDLDFSADGLTRLVRTDVYGAYIWDSTTSKWRNLITATALGITSSSGFPNFASVYDVRHAPSNSAIIYMVFDGAPDSYTSTVWKSTDRGVTFTNTGGPIKAMSVREVPGRLHGPKMAVDPSNSDHVILGDSAGLFWRTTNGGTSWAQITATSLPTSSLIYPIVCFDPTTPTTIYLAWGNGTNRVWRSTNGGTSFTQLAGGPNTIRRMIVAADSTLYCTEVTSSSYTNAWKLVGTTWTNFTGGNAPAPDNVDNNWFAVAVDPTNSNRVFLSSSAGNLNYSGNKGTTWSGWYPAAPIRSAPNIPWMAWTKEDYFTTANILFDPTVSNKLWFANGIGTWYTTPPEDGSQPTYIESSVGNETLIVDDIVVPPGGKPLVACQDRAIFRINDPEVYPSVHGPARDASIRHCWNVAYAPSNPLICAIYANGGSGGPGLGNDLSGISTDGGVTWTPFADLTPGNAGPIGGSIAVWDANHIVMASSGNGLVYVTNNGGASWTTPTFTGAPTGAITGWGNSAYDIRHVVCVDQVTAGKGYIFNQGDRTGTQHGAGVWQTTDYGQTWTRVFPAAGLGQEIAGNGTSVAGTKLSAVPGHANHVYWACTAPSNARDPHPSNTAMYRSTDGGATWNEVTSTDQVWAFGFGKANGSDYPAVYIIGWVNGVYGVYRSDNTAAEWAADTLTWTLLTTFALDYVGMPFVIAGDLDTYGKFYIGFGASGAAYGQLDLVSSSSSTGSITVTSPNKIKVRGKSGR